VVAQAQSPTLSDGFNDPATDFQPHKPRRAQSCASRPSLPGNAHQNTPLSKGKYQAVSSRKVSGRRCILLAI
ncbi:MAG TPA: hypothetical protein VGH29_11440, partial [Candidatus Binataceae bacterium]